MYSALRCRPGESYRRRLRSLLMYPWWSLCSLYWDACQVSYRRRLRSLMLDLCYLFWVLINSLVCCFLLYSQRKRQNNSLHIQPRPLAAEQASKFPAQQYFELINPLNARDIFLPVQYYSRNRRWAISQWPEMFILRTMLEDTGLPKTGQWSALCQGHCMTMFLGQVTGYRHCTQ